MKSLSCPNRHFPPSRKGDAGAIIRHGFYMTRWGKRRRYQCQLCGKTFCSTTGTPYHRLQHRAPLNTSFVERLNLTIRQGSAYLLRRTICQARWKQRLEDHLDLLRCHYNFARRHRGLRFGSEMRTPAMQAGLARRRLTFREIFSSAIVFWASENLVFLFTKLSRSASVTTRRMPLAA